MFIHLPIFTAHTTFWDIHNMSTISSFCSYLHRWSFLHSHLKKKNYDCLYTASQTIFFGTCFFNRLLYQEIIKYMLTFNISFLVWQQGFKAQLTKPKRIPLNLFSQLLWKQVFCLPFSCFCAYCILYHISSSLHTPQVVRGNSRAEGEMQALSRHCRRAREEC